MDIMEMDIPFVRNALPIHQLIMVADQQMVPNFVAFPVSTQLASWREGLQVAILLFLPVLSATVEMFVSGGTLEAMCCLVISIVKVIAAHTLYGCRKSAKQ